MLIEIQNHNFIEMLTFTVSLLAIFGHNLWLVGKEEPAKKTRIEINTGDNFPASETAVKTERIKEFKIISEKGERRIEDFHVRENSLTAVVEENSNTAFVAAVELLPHPITLKAEKFVHYIEDEDAQDFTAPDFVIDKSNEPQRESYAKYAKVLVKNHAEDFSIFTEKINHRLEIIMLEVPAKDKKILPVQVLFEGNPVRNLRVSSGAENLHGGRYSFHTRTDENGFAQVEIAENGHCFVRTHFIRRHSDAANFEWESFWASVTFRV